MKILASYEVEQGITTNRVRKVRTKQLEVATKKPKPKSSAGAAIKRYREDPEKGRGFTLVCISMPVEDLIAIDKSAEAAQMSRSHYLRQAAKLYRGGIGIVEVKAGAAPLPWRPTDQDWGKIITDAIESA